MHDDYADVQTVECPSCQKTTLVYKWNTNENGSGKRLWVCKCGKTCLKEVRTIILGELNGY